MIKGELNVNNLCDVYDAELESSLGNENCCFASIVLTQVRNEVHNTKFWSWYTI